MISSGSYDSNVGDMVTTTSFSDYRGRGRVDAPAGTLPETRHISEQRSAGDAYGQRGDR